MNSATFSNAYKYYDKKRTMLCIPDNLHSYKPSAVLIFPRCSRTDNIVHNCTTYVMLLHTRTRVYRKRLSHVHCSERDSNTAQ